MVLLDTSAWIELFTGSKKGEKVKKYIRKSSVYTSIVSIAEISNWARKNNLDGMRFIKDTIALSQLIDLNINLAFLAGELNYERKKSGKKWGMMDSLIYSTAKLYNLKTLTADKGFSDLKKVELL